MSPSGAIRFTADDEGGVEVLVCPGCKARMQVKAGRTLPVQCPRCARQFAVEAGRTAPVTPVAPPNLPMKFLQPISKVMNQDWAVNNYADVDPRPRGDNKMTEHLKDLADFVRERGGGLLATRAEAAGLPVSNGIAVDEFLRTADSRIYGIGDCAEYPNPFAGSRVRLESVQNAVDQAVCDLEICRLVRQLLDRVAPVTEDAGFPVKVTDRARSEGSGHECRVVEPDARQ